MNRWRYVVFALAGLGVAFAFEPGDAIERFIEREALTGYVRERSVAVSATQIEAAVATLLREGAGVDDAGVVAIVARAVLDRAPGGSLALALAAGDVEAVQGSLLEETASALVTLVATAGGPVASAVESVGVLATALGQVAGGDATGAASTLAAELGRSVGVTDLVEVTRDVRDHVVNNLWLDPAIEAAFVAYRDGANDPRGYSVPKGDFEAVLEQITPGVLREYQLRYLEAAAASLGVSSAALSDAERAALRREAEDALRDSFEERVVREPEIAQREAALRNVFEAFDRRGLLFTDATNPMVPTGVRITEEQLASRIMGFVARVQRDTGRFVLVTDDEFVARVDDGRRVPPYAIAAAAMAWYTAAPEEREAAYRASLIADGLLPAEPEPEDFATQLGRAFCAGYAGRASILAEDPRPLWNDYYAAGDPRVLALDEANELFQRLREEGAGQFHVEQGICTLCPGYASAAGAFCN